MAIVYHKQHVHHNKEVAPPAPAPTAPETAQDLPSDASNVGVDVEQVSAQEEPIPNPEIDAVETTPEIDHVVPEIEPTVEEKAVVPTQAPATSSKPQNAKNQSNGKKRRR